MDKSIKNIRKEFKQKGIFYTPNELAEKLKSYVDIEPKTVYDPTCGAGNLLKIWGDDIEKFGQELDPEEFNKIKIPNFRGYVGDTLQDDGFKDLNFDCILANPPFSIKWTPDKLKEDVRFKDFEVLPPPSKADWAFLIHILHHLKKDGIAVTLNFPGILYRGNKEGKIREWFLKNNYIDRVVHIDGDTFEDTKIATCILVLKKNKKTTDVIFEDKEKTRIVPFEEIEKADFNLSVNYYLQDEIEKEEVDIDKLNKELVDALISSTDKVLRFNIEMENELNEEFYSKKLKKGLLEVIANHI